MGRYPNRYGRARPHLHGRGRPVRSRAARPRKLQQGMGLVFGIPRLRLDLHRIRAPAPQRHGLQRHGRPDLHAHDRNAAGMPRVAGGSGQRLRLPLFAPARDGDPGILPAPSGRLRHRSGTDSHRAGRIPPLRISRNAGKPADRHQPVRRQRRRPGHGDLSGTGGRPHDPGLPLFDRMVQTTTHLLLRPLLHPGETGYLQGRPSGGRKQRRTGSQYQGDRASSRRHAVRIGKSRNLPGQHVGGRPEHRERTPGMGFRRDRPPHSPKVGARIGQGHCRRRRRPDAENLLHGTLSRIPATRSLQRLRRPLPGCRRDGA